MTRRAGATLQVASQRGAYALTDRATYLAERDLGPVGRAREEPGLLNVYHVVVVNPAKHPGVNVTAALAWAAWLVRPDVQAMIGSFGVARSGQPLFVPAAGKPELAG
ncbi:MAG: hypothetical protein IVW36_03080 [Dehalococcoidia bacterium]|nr:hypothetical protein [Dehalococcoidia bacterium]